MICLHSFMKQTNQIFFAVKTPNGITTKEKIENKVLQGDVLSPMLSSNMVDHNIGKPAILSNNVYLYKNKEVIPPLTMQDDTLGISECGFKSRKMNNFLNTRANIMNLQFGRDKCEKMHIGKDHDENICIEFEMDTWKDTLKKNINGEEEVLDEYDGKRKMKMVSEKK